MEVQAALGSDIALAFDECTPFHVERDYTAGSMERTHRWLDRCVAWHGEHGPPGQLLYGIVQGGVYEDLRAQSTAYVGRGGRARHRHRRLARPVEGADARGGRLVAARPARGPAAAPARHRRRGRPRPRGRRRHRHLRLRDAHAAGAPRHRPRPGPGEPLAGRPGQGRPPHEHRADRRALRLPRLPRAHARLPALPRPGRTS